MKYLIVNGDDFGFSPGVNQGIQQAHRAGILTSTTVMVNLAFAGQIREAAAENPGLGVGVHLNITYGRPLLPAPKVNSLLGAGGAFLRPEAGFGKVNPDQVKEEWRAQVELMLSWGIRLTHLDSHHHVHTWPELREVITEIAQAYGLPVRYTDQPTRQSLFDRDIRVTHGFIGDFYGEQATVDKLLEVIASLPEGVSELMCHPAVVDQELVSHSSYTQPRNQELESLCSPQVAAELRNLGIMLINYGDLSDILKSKAYGQA